MLYKKCKRYTQNEYLLYNMCYIKLRLSVILIYFICTVVVGIYSYGHSIVLPHDKFGLYFL